MTAFACTISADAFAAFPDVKRGNPFKASIQYIANEGIVSGYPDGTYKPFGKINRAEFTKIIVGSVYDMHDLNLQTGVSHFSDMTGDEWYAPYVNKAKAEGIIDGYPDGTFGGEKPVNFAEASKIVTNTFEVPITLSTDFGYWWLPYVHALSGVNGAPRPSPDPASELNRGQMAEIIYRLHHGLGNWELLNDPDLDFWLSYPTSLLDVSVDNGAVEFSHSHTVNTVDPCQFRDDRPSKKTVFEDLHLRIRHVDGGLEDAMSAEQEIDLLEKFTENGGLELEKDYITFAYFGNFYGYKITRSAEGCGEHAYFVTDNEGNAFIIHQKIITELGDTVTASARSEYMNMQGVILPAEEARIVEDILESIILKDSLDLLGRGLLAIV